MIRIAIILIWIANIAWAQNFGGLARIDLEQSDLSMDGDDFVIDLQLDQTVPYRVFTLNDPKRAVLEFREIDWQDTPTDAFAQDGSVQFGNTSNGWSRIVVGLSKPMIVSEAGMTVDDASGAARVTVRLAPVSEDVFELRAQTPAQEPLRPSPRPVNSGPMVIVIDPGHGGLDPGAQRGGANEADLMLRLGIEVAEGLARAGFRAVLTRDSDTFVPLADRMTLARDAGASLLISLHADALEIDEARGASVYTLTEAAVDDASARMAERHERGDLLTGVDLTDQDDRVATVLMDLARLETVPQSNRFADTLVASLRSAGAPINSRPRRKGRLAVLNAADFASVLVEVGFLSSPRDREMLSSNNGRAPLVAGLVNAVQRWAVDEAARAPLVRQ